MQVHAPNTLASLLVIPFSELPSEFKNTPFLSHAERGILTFLLSKGDIRNGGMGVPFSRQWVNESLDTRYNVHQTWKRLMDRGFIEKITTNDPVSGLFGSKYVVHLRPQLLKPYEAKRRERFARVYDMESLDSILTQFETQKIDKMAAMSAIASIRTVAVRLSHLPAAAGSELVETPVQALEQQAILSATVVAPTNTVTDVTELWDLHDGYKVRILSNDVLMTQIKARCEKHGYAFSENVFLDFEKNLRIHLNRTKPYSNYDNYYKHFWEFLVKFNPEKGAGKGSNLRFNKVRKMIETPHAQISEEKWTQAVHSVIAFEPKSNDGALSETDNAYRLKLSEMHDKGTLSAYYLEKGGKMPIPTKAPISANKPVVAPVQATNTVAPSHAKPRPRVELRDGKITTVDFTESYEDLKPMFESLCKLLETGQISIAMFIGFLNNAFRHFESSGKRALFLRLKMLLEERLEKPMYDTLERAKQSLQNGMFTKEQYDEKVKSLSIWNAARCDDALKKLIN